MEEIDLTKDRDEFKKRLEKSSILDCFSLREILEALLFNDTEKLNEIKSVKSNIEIHINNYLSQYDQGEEEQKRTLVNSVKRYER